MPVFQAHVTETTAMRRRYVVEAEDREDAEAKLETGETVEEQDIPQTAEVLCRVVDRDSIELVVPEPTSADKVPSEAQNIFASLDGPLFRRQRELLLKLADQARHSQPITLTEQDQELLEGLINLTDALADEAHDRYGINCLIT